MLQYFYEWTEISPSSFETTVGDVLSLKYNHLDIAKTNRVVQKFVTTLDNDPAVLSGILPVVNRHVRGGSRHAGDSTKRSRPLGREKSRLRTDHSKAGRDQFPIGAYLQGFAQSQDATADHQRIQANAENHHRAKDDDGAGNRVPFSGRARTLCHILSDTGDSQEDTGDIGRL